LFSTRALKNKGYEVIEAESAERALEILHDTAQRVDLVITDVVMPKMDGPTLIKQVRELYPERALKVIFISGYAEDNFRQRLGDDIDIHFLPKPFSLKQLAGKVKEVLAESD
jgi:two-component system cell cycle sensor histidine kinase/response regulator CckA